MTDYLDKEIPTNAENIKLLVSIIVLLCSITAIYFTWRNNKRLIKNVMKTFIIVYKVAMM